MRDITDQLLEVLVRDVEALPQERKPELSEEVVGLTSEYLERRAVESAFRAQFPSAGGTA